jgi:CheY-like chemotaxis protein
MTDQSRRSVQDVIEAYCASFPDQMSRLMDLLNCRHFSSANVLEIAKTVYAEVHRMHGAAQCLGFRDLGRELARIEARLEKGLRLRRRTIEEDLESVVEKIAQIALMAPTIIPENSRLISRNLIDEDQSEEAGTSEPQSMTDALSSQRILFADDDPHVRDLVESTLKSLGVVHLKSVSSGLEVLNSIRDFSPDIIITDWQMQPVSGLELLECVRNGGTSLEKSAPIIFFTSNRSRESRMQALVHGASHLLTKPVSPEILSKTLLEVISARLLENITSDQEAA